MQSFLHGYMKERLDESFKDRTCNEHDGAGGGVCDLSPKRRQVLNTRTTTLNKIFPHESSSTLNNVSVMSRTICVWLEAWISTLSKERGKQGEVIFRGNCTYDKFIEGIERGNLSKECIFEKGKLAWIDHRSRSSLSMAQDYQRGLKSCMEIVTLILVTAGLTSTAATKNYYNKRKSDLCQDIYEKLAEWGGKNLAKRIMKDWFTQAQNNGSGGRIFQLSGRDVYEIITEGIFGVSSGDKSLRCDLQEETSNREADTVEKYSTSLSEDTIVPSGEENFVFQDKEIEKMNQVLDQVEEKVKVKQEALYLDEG
ncbi:hypothetical protein C922_05390 [Plasmodium inui San Antonio 1]|uniref:Uncharacterized protein n=1 Tax=Plasmodium inui San Antonio 1 TaxID=1237626 RepID=W7A543_9APIC|nr:hypothetical protein C922_05390 [Plasmodium inui San Antonio 1]EUD64224.1 hypothetical protein C922_05390 [Plasmodium inui San Antonio 1]